MDLREALAEELHQALLAHSCGDLCPGNGPDDDDYRAAEAALARLSQPDVLDEFERRCGEAMGRVAKQTTMRGVECSPALAAPVLRRVLADMLEGES